MEMSESEKWIITCAIEYTRHDGAYGTDCDLKNAVKNHLTETNNPLITELTE